MVRNHYFSHYLVQDLEFFLSGFAMGKWIVRINQTKLIVRRVVPISIDATAESALTKVLCATAQRIVLTEKMRLRVVIQAIFNAPAIKFASRKRFYVIVSHFFFLI
jgi:hypothetical protein